MHTKIKTAWAKRLREMGDDMQTTNMLGTPDGKRCCLGVLCDMAVEEGVIDPPLVQTNFSIHRLQYANHNGQLPPPVAKWAGLEIGNGDIIIGEKRAIELNDHKGWKFSQIAALLHKTPAKDIKDL